MTIQQTRYTILLLYCLLPALCSLTVQHVFAQHLNYTAYDLNYKVYFPENKLISQNIRVLYQDKQQLLFVGTKKGVSIYDGYKFKSYEVLPGGNLGRVNDFYEQGDSSMLIATDHKQVFVYHKGSFRSLNVGPVPTVVNFHQAVDGSLLAATRQGLYKIKDTLFQLIVPAVAGQTFYDIDSVSRDVLIASGLDKLVLFNHHFQLLDTLITGTVYDTQLDADNKIWLACPNGLKMLDANAAAAGHLVPVDLPLVLKQASLQKAIVISLMEDAGRNIWIGTIHDGLYKYTHEGRLLHYTKRNGFPYEQVISFMEDAEKSIWIGTEQGLVKVPNPVLDFYNSLDGLSSNNVAAIIQQGDDLLLGSDLNISVLSAGTSGSVADLQAVENCLAFTPMEEGLWLTARNALYTVQYNKAKQQKKIKKLYDVPDSLGSFRSKPVLCPDGSLLFGTKKGILVYRDKRFYTLRGYADDTRSLAYDISRKLLWVCTASAGLQCYRITQQDTSLHPVSTIDSLPKQVRTVFSDMAGRLWVGTLLDGLYMLRPDNNGNCGKPLHITMKDGLSSNCVLHILEDNQHNTWLGTDMGVDKLHIGNGVTDLENFSKYYDFHGEVYSLYKAADGSIWTGGLNGLTRIDVDALGVALSRPLARLSAVQVSGARDTLIYEPTVPLQSGYNSNTFSFEFTSPSFKKEIANEFSYRLRGAKDTAWSDVSGRNSVIYAQLSPGQYSFEVKTRNALGVWSATPAIYSFVVTPPFWERTWFRLLMAVAVVALGYLFYRYRIHHILQLNTVRNRISRDLHDDIGATLSSINILTEVARQKVLQQQSAQSVAILEKVNIQARETVDRMGDTIWAINPNNDNIEKLIERIRYQFLPVCQAKGIQLSIVTSGDVRKLRPGMDQRKQLYMVTKEAINNAVKYSGCQQLVIKAVVQKDGFLLSITDDGSGFVPEQAIGGNGLKNMRERVAAVQGVLLVQSAPGEGTTIEISCGLGDLEDGMW